MTILPCEQCFMWNEHSSFLFGSYVSSFSKFQVFTKKLESSKVHVKSLSSLHSAIGCAEEAGEILGLFKKETFYGKPIDKDELIEELGDLFHYMSRLMYNYELSLTDIIQANVNKLGKRFPNGYSDKDAIGRADKREK